MITDRSYIVTEAASKGGANKLLDGLYVGQAPLIRLEKTVEINAFTQNSGPVPILVVDKWAEGEYARLSASWVKYGISLPDFSRMLPLLKKAYKVINTLSLSSPQLRFRLGILFVPATSDLDFPISNDARFKHKFGKTADSVSVSFPKPKAAGWKLMVTCTGLNGLYLNIPKNVINSHPDKISKYNTVGLDAFEYAALTLQSPHIIDRGLATVLLKHYSGGELVPMAMFSEGAYRFFVAHIETYFYDFRYRPAIEIS